MFQNDLSLDSYLTLFELVGQDIAKTQSDMKIKSDSELPTLKEKLKKSEATWKNLQGILLRKLAGYADGKAFLHEPQSPWNKQPKPPENCPKYKTRLLNLIRFQVQLAITSPSLVKDSNTQAQDRMKLFVEKVYDSMASLLTKYLAIEHFEQNHPSKRPIATNSFLIESFDLLADESIDNKKEIPLEGKEADKFIDIYLATLDEYTKESLLDKKVEFYWTDLGGLSPNHISKSKSRKIEPSARQVSMKVVLSSHYSKRSHKEFLDFCDSFGNYYERYFSETEFGANPLEVLLNFSKLVFLLMKAFSLPGRTGSDDLKTLLNQLLTNLRIPQILPWIIRSLRILIRQESDLVETEALLATRLTIADPERNLEFRLLGVNLLRLIQFILHHAEGETSCISNLLKVTYFLHYSMWTDADGYPDERVFKLHRLVHLLIHKNTNACCIKVHSIGFDTELKLFVLNMQLNLLSRKLNPPTSENEDRKRRSSQMQEEHHHENRNMSHRRIEISAEGDQTASDVEKELVQMLRCFYCRRFLIKSFSSRSATILIRSPPTQSPMGLSRAA